MGGLVGLGSRACCCERGEAMSQFEKVEQESTEALRARLNAFGLNVAGMSRDMMDVLARMLVPIEPKKRRAKR